MRVFLRSTAVLSSLLCLTAATPLTPSYYVHLAKTRLEVGDKTAFLKRLLEQFPSTPEAQPARDQLVALLSGSNRFDEALQVHETANPVSGSRVLDWRALDYLLKTGAYAEVLRRTENAAKEPRSLTQDLRVLEARTQAYLAQGEFAAAQKEVARWLALYKPAGGKGMLYESDVRSIDYLERHLKRLQRLAGAKGKPLFTAMVPDSLRRWSQRRHVPIAFYKLIPARSGGTRPERLLAGRYETDPYFEEQVRALNNGFDYLSGGRFSLQYSGSDTLYVHKGDLDSGATGGRLLTSRVYAHTLPKLYEKAGEGFTILIDYRESAAEEAAYMGDGIIYLSAAKLKTLILMHEILHGLGATHQDWNYLERQGYHFDPQDRGLMTFENGDIKYLGLESKNRAVVGWSPVAVVKLSNPAFLFALSPTGRSPETALLPSPPKS